MAGSTYGTIFSNLNLGESHGAGIGVVIDGCPQVFLSAKTTFRST